MPVTNEVIREVLNSLDHKNDALWTDDGSPLVGEIQRLTNDKTVTRAQINEAQPGFFRILAVAVDDDTAEDPTEGVGAAPDPSIVLKTTDTPPAVDPNLKAEVAVSDAGLSEADRRIILVRRIHDAEQAIMDAKRRLSEAQADVVRAEKRHARAIADCHNKFPPITAAENIKQHLAAQQELLRQRVEGEGSQGRSPIDISLSGRAKSKRST